MLFVVVQFTYYVKKEQQDMLDFLNSVVFAEPETGETVTTETTETTETVGTESGTAGEGTDPDATGGFGGVIGSFIPLILMVVVFYFILIRPQKKQEKKQKAMLAALQVGDKVVTIGGICGKISKLKDEYVFIETGSVGNPNEKSIIKFERSAIRTVETIHE